MGLSEKLHRTGISKLPSDANNTSNNRSENMNSAMFCIVISFEKVSFCVLPTYMMFEQDLPL